MRTLIISALFSLATLAVAGLFLQGCVKPGDAETSTQEGEAELTITGEAI
jgi:hypothetical protein